MSSLSDANDLPPAMDSDKPNEMNVDEVIRETGCGLSQFLLEIICIYINFSFAYQTLIMYYAADNPPWRCISRESKFCNASFGKEFKVADDDFNKRCDLKRSDWDYTKSKKYSIVTEYDLVCSVTYVAALVNAAFFIGWGVGGVFTGVLADKYGRKWSLCVSLFTLVLFAVGSCYITAIWQLGLLRGLIGISTGTCFTVLFIYLSELSSPEYRSLSMNLVQIFFSVSLIALSALAMYVQKWRDLQLYATIPGILSFFISIIIPESPRWLNETGKVHKAENVLRKIAKLNKKESITFSLKAPLKKGESKYSYIHLFNNCSIAVFVLAQAFGWFAVGLVYFALSLESSALGGSIYTNFILSNLADIVGDFITIFACNYFGRKRSVLFSLIFGGIVLACIAAVPKSSSHGSTIRIILAMVGKAAVIVSFCGYYVWSVELYPTILRTQGLTVCQISSRIGAATAPFITSVLQAIYQPLPFIIMAVTSVIAGILGLVLPETNKKPTRETFDDIYDNKDYINNFDVEPLLN